jgi:O-acetylserine/cysteine efflux transporter
MTAPPSRLGARDLAVAALMNVMWALNIIAAKMAVTEVAPLTAAFLRQVIVCVVCLSWLRIVPGQMRALAGLGVLTGGLFFVFINLSLLAATNVSALAIAGQLGVPFSMILAVLVLGERIHRYRIAGVALSFLGVGILLFDPGIVNEVAGIALQVVASAIWACASLIQRNVRDVPILTVYAWIGLIGVMMLAPIALIFEPHGMATIPRIPLSSFGWIAFSAIGSTLLGHGSMAWLIQRHPISVVAPLTLAAPVLSVLVASWYFRTPLTPVMILGGIVALGGVAIVTIRSAKAGEARGV